MATACYTTAPRMLKREISAEDIMAKIRALTPEQKAQFSDWLFTRRDAGLRALAQPMALLAAREIQQMSGRA